MTHRWLGEGWQGSQPTASGAQLITVEGAEGRGRTAPLRGLFVKLPFSDVLEGEG